jgi:hypothetical protein
VQFLFWILDVRVDEKGIHFAVDVLDWDLEATDRSTGHYYTFISTFYCTYIRLTDYYVNTVQVFFTDYYEFISTFYCMYISFTVHYYVNTVQVLFNDYYAFISTFYCKYISFYYYELLCYVFHLIMSYYGHSMI